MLQKKYGNSGAVNGLSSSLAFTPIQGIELADPNQARSPGHAFFYPPDARGNVAARRTHAGAGGGAAQRRLPEERNRLAPDRRPASSPPARPPQNKMALGTGSGTDSVFSEFRGFSKVQRQLKQ